MDNIHTEKNRQKRGGEREKERNRRYVLQECRGQLDLNGNDIQIKIQ